MLRKMPSELEQWTIIRSRPRASTRALLNCLNRYDTSSRRQTWCTSQVGKGCPKASEPWSPAPVCAAAIFADTANTTQCPEACNPSPGTPDHPLASAPPAPSDTRPKPAPAPPIEPIALESPVPSTVDGARAEIKASHGGLKTRFLSCYPAAPNRPGGQPVR
jgi:hypothetical protein